MTLERLQLLGFDKTDRIPFQYNHVACSQCEALVINGVPTHEIGCPNVVRECHGCGELVLKHQKYCQDCS